MKIEKGFLRSKVARRAVVLFTLSALIPIAVTAFFSFTYVTDLLVNQSHKSLHHAAKLYGMAVLDRLHVVDDKLHHLSENTRRQDLNDIYDQIDQIRREPQVIEKSRYKKQVDSLDVQIIPTAGLSLEDYGFAGKDRAVIYSQTNDDGIRKVYLRRILATDNQQTALLVAELNNEYLWGDREELPFSTFLCVIENDNTVLFCSHDEHQALLARLNGSAPEVTRYLRWSTGEQTYLAVAWELFVKSSFSGTNWQITASRPKTDALMALDAFQNIFPLVILLSLLVVLLFSMIQVRRSMVPLERLVAGTKRLANYNFRNLVEVRSDDEFGQLADSFNVMARRLEKQFNALKMLSEIDRSILAYPDLDVVIARIFDTADKVMACDFIVISLLDTNDADPARNYIKENRPGSPTRKENFVVHAGELAALATPQDMLCVDLTKTEWPILQPLHDLGAVVARVYPIRLEDRIRAIFTLGYRADVIGDDEEHNQVKEIIDRLAVAVASADRDKKLYQQAHFDHLTGLPNRQLFNDRLKQHLNQADRSKKYVALLYIDLDRFKNINDLLGHAGGDQMLLQTVERLRRCVRETDTVSRLGGDEFVIALSSISHPQDAAIVAENIVEAMAPPFYINSREIFTSASIGIAIYPDDGTDNKELLAHADAAMYRVKESGRGRFMFFEESMNKEIAHRVEMETDMRRAFERDEFMLHYQPQVDLVSGRVVGVEALMRWNHPRHGPIPPNRFIPLAEECGLIERLGEWVLRRACEQYQNWRAQGLSPGSLAVNISSRQFMRSDFADTIKAIIAETGIKPGELQLEITESLLLDERINAKVIFGALEAMGVQLAIDDFGTGYSSLSYLKRFPVHILKIDRSFTRDIPADAQTTTLTLSIITMAHALNMQVVAEGVERNDQLELFKAHQCDVAQGDYISRALPEYELLKFLRQCRDEAISLN